MCRRGWRRSRSLIEPIILIVMGVVVVIILIALYLPILEFGRERQNPKHRDPASLA